MIHANLIVAQRKAMSEGEPIPIGWLLLVRYSHRETQTLLDLFQRSPEARVQRFRQYWVIDSVGP